MRRVAKSHPDRRPTHLGHNAPGMATLAQGAAAENETGSNTSNKNGHAEELINYTGGAALHGGTRAGDRAMRTRLEQKPNKRVHLACHKPRVIAHVICSASKSADGIIVARYCVTQCYPLCLTGSRTGSPFSFTTKTARRISFATYVGMQHCLHLSL